MTYVGKILVIIILVFALFFLAFATVVFTTATDWKGKSEANAKTITETKTQLLAVQAKADAATANLEASKKDFEGVTKQLKARITDLERENDTRQKEISDNRKSLEASELNTKEALAEAKARTEEADTVKSILVATQKQANEFKEQQRDLKDKIRVLEREVDVAKDANSKLRERVTKYIRVLDAHKIPPDSVVSSSLAPPPAVEGKILKVDARNRHVEISIGSDDGLAVGHVLSVFRTSPSPAFIGRILIEAVEPDKAAGSVQGTTVKGQKIMEGDDVASEIRPRG